MFLFNKRELFPLGVCCFELIDAGWLYSVCETLLTSLLRAQNLPWPGAESVGGSMNLKLG